MAYDEKLAERVRKKLKGTRSLEEKKMFGGLAFLRKGRMCCGIVKDQLMVRVPPEEYESLLAEPGATVMDFTGRPMKGFLFVKPEGCASDARLRFWLDRATELSGSKEAKKTGKRSRAQNRA